MLQLLWHASLASPLYGSSPRFFRPLRLWDLCHLLRPGRDGGIAGGYLADKIIGIRHAITLGGLLIAAGHLCLAFGDPHSAFFWSLALIVIGSSLFSGNITALLGQFYEKEDPRRESGFTLFYMGINSGALLATLSCGVIGETWGWHYGFGLAAVGMLLGNLAFFSFQSLLEGKGGGPLIEMKKKWIAGLLSILIGVPVCLLFIKNEAYFLFILPWMSLLAAGWTFYRIRRDISVQKLLTLSGYLAILSLFFAAEEQIGSSLMIFSEKFSTKSIGGFAFPSSLLLSVNPTVIIIGGFLLNRFHATSSPLRLTLRIGLACAMGSSAFFILSGCCLWPAASQGVPGALLLLVFAMISTAELLLAPAVIAYCSEIAPKTHQGVMMGLIPLAFSFASLLGGFFSKSLAGAPSSPHEIEAYRQGFNLIALLLGMLILLPLAQGILIYKKKVLS